MMMALQYTHTGVLEQQKFLLHLYKVHMSDFLDDGGRA
jgi:hypothetical protein